ncbi:TPA: hypothetical protein PRU35_004706 [Escherichia coli]|uniref:hypothetical protein n=1 Tax=Escherichia coli TaxID=562 RepID=UPI0003EE4EAE|nr:hypothetical protein [Escherichia coli]EEW2614614.1 hypothetical protein [Escherichia coli]EFF0682281.1 hypothetical protein [Escherichia coli]EFM0289453.1 hypothetical protein [Escherichia coli]EGY1225017.1 hypothetical protein [Escherichia coli]EHO1963329.1 hypothetical protein [Escherichia coli]
MFINEFNKINITTDTGVYFEIRDFFSSQPNVSNFEIMINEDEFNISIKMESLDILDVKNLFLSFVSFIQYEYFACYKKSVKDERIIYELITSNENLNGFYCKLSISL